MKIFFAFALTAAVSSFLIKDYDHRFLEYLAEHGKSYDTMEEYELRKEQFTRTHSFIIAHNSDTTRTFKLGHNHKSDWTEAEISRLYQDEQENPKTSPVYFDSDEILVDDFDVSELNETLDENLDLEDIEETPEEYLDFDEIVQYEDDYFDFAELDETLDDSFDFADTYESSEIDLVEGSIGSNLEESDIILTDDVLSAQWLIKRSTTRRVTPRKRIVARKPAAKKRPPPKKKPSTPAAKKKTQPLKPPLKEPIAPPPGPQQRTEPVYEHKFDSPFDWRQTPVKGSKPPTEQSFVPPVQDQGMCGSCWAFTAVSVLESAWFIHKEDKLYSLSTQQLVDCVYAQDTTRDGCNGGKAFKALEYYSNQNAILERYYPYQSGVTKKQGACQIIAQVTPVKTQPRAFFLLPKDSTDGKGIKSITIKKYLALQPLVTRLSINGLEFNNYKKDLLDSKACGTGGHAVVFVGWGKNDQGKEYWIVQNSHGAGWGMNGYFQVPIDDSIQNQTAARNGLCGIQEEVYFPNV